MMNEQKNEQKPSLTLVAEDEPVAPPEPEPEAQLDAGDIPIAAKRKAAREFKEWKQQLMDMLRRKASIVWSRQGGKLVYHFVLPSDLVKLVWNTTIKERVKLEELKDSEGAVRRAIEGIRAEVDAATGAVVQQRRAAADQAIRQTIEHLNQYPHFAAGQQESHAEADPVPQAQAPAEGNPAPVEDPTV